jgi:proteasome accessory factor A
VARSLFGLEAELAVSATCGGTAVPVDHVAWAFAQAAQRTLVHLRGGRGRIFLANGGLFYIDHGCHPEYATAECTTPTDAVCHLLAGQRLVARLAAIARDELRAERVLVCRSNVDYHAGTSWGCHESYLGSQPIAAYESWLIPHLASRIVYTGSGGLDPLSPGIRFSLSPRVAHLEMVVSPESTRGRGLFHTRDEPLCRGYSRVHVLAGDNACAHRATWLKIGTTALVMALADWAAPASCPIRLSKPLRALRRFARDHRDRAQVELRHGPTAQMTAVDIQRQLLAMVEPHAGGSHFPEWTPAVCSAWKEALDLIEAPAINASHAFDWPLKYGLLRREIARRGFREPVVAAWSDALERLSPLRRPDGSRALFINRAEIEKALSERLLPQAALDDAGRLLGEHGLSWGGLEEFNMLRRELCAIDVQFGELGAGIFETLDRQGVLPDHRVVTEAEIQGADSNAPVGSRAAVRARWVETLADQRERYACDWTCISGEGRRLDLSDPFATTETWLWP